MANDLSAVIPKLLAQGLEALREQAVTPRLVNRAYESMAGERGSTIDVPIPSAVGAIQVAPANVAPNPGDLGPTSVPIVLDQWYEAPFQLSDRDRLEVMDGIIPMQASEAIKSLANQVDSYLLGQYVKVFGWSGEGDTPFADGVGEYLEARKVLNNQLAPMDPRYVVLDTDAEANALNLRAFQDASFRGDTDGIINGQIGRKLGALWLMNQNIPTHTAGTGAGYLVNNVAGYAVGAKTVAVDTGAGTVLPGDIIIFSGHTQTYTVVSSVGGGTVTSITFEAGLVAPVADNETVTLKPDHVVNLVFHRDAFALASRPLSDTSDGLGRFMSAVDPISGLTLRLEVTREFKRTRYSFDILWGAQCVRPQLATRLTGNTPTP